MRQPRSDSRPGEGSPLGPRTHVARSRHGSVTRRPLNKRRATGGCHRSSVGSTAMKLNELVYGESVEALTPGILTIGDNLKPAKDGSVHCSVRLEPERGNPLRRALLRVEAELLREDAD